MSSSPNKSGASRREQLRLQQEQQAARLRRNRLITVIAGVLAAVVILGAIGYAIYQQNQSKGSSVAIGSQVTPTNAVGTTGMVVKPAGAKDLVANAPTLAEYQDYQCPVCKTYFTVFGPAINQLAAEGKIKLEYRTLTFLDTNLQNDASTRAAVAAACADTVGAYEKYHDTVYANQPEKEGTGYTDQQLRSDFATQAGITGDNLTKFQKCYDERQTINFVKAVNESGNKAGINSTPTFMVEGNGKSAKVDLSKVSPTADAVLAAIQAAVA